MKHHARLLHLLLLVTLAGSLLAPVGGVISAQEPGTPEPSEEFQTAATGTVSLRLIARDESNQPLDNVCFSINDGTVFASCTGEQGTPGESLVEGLAAGSYTVQPIPPSGYISSGPQTLNVDDGGTAEFWFIVTQEPAPQLEVTVTASNEVIAAGAAVVFDITVTNTGDGPANNVMVVDTLPFGIDWIVNAGGCDISAGTLVCNLGTLEAGGSATIRVTGATSTVQCGVLDNTATVSASNAPDATDSASVTVTCPDISIELFADAETINAGETASFTITVTNSGTGPADNVAISESLPTGLMWTVHAGGANCAIAGSTLACTLDTVAPGEVVEVTLTAPTSSQDCGVISLGSASITVTCPDLVIAVVADPETINAGDIASFTITVTNVGTGTAHDVNVAEVLPPGDWTIDPEVAGCAIANDVLECALGSLAPFENVEVTVSATTSVADCGILSNMATVVASNESSDTISNNSDTASVTVLCAPDLVIGTTPDSGSVNAGDPVGFTFTITNIGAGTADNVTLSEVLPVGLVWTVDAGSAACVITDGMLDCALGELASGQTASVTVTATTSSQDCGPIYLGSASTVINCPDIAVTKVESSPTVNAGDPVSFTITVENFGPGAAYDVNLIDEVPIGFVWAENSERCTIASDILACDFGTLLPSASFAVTVTAETTGAQCGQIANTVSVSASNESASMMVNNQSMATIEIVCSASIQVTLFDENGDPLPGGCFELFETEDGVQFGDYLGTNCDSYDSSDDGVTRFTDVLPGSYIVRQSWAPSMYPRMGQQVITVTAAEPAELDFQSVLGGKVTIRFFEGATPALDFAASVHYDDGAGGAGEFVMNGSDDTDWDGPDAADGQITIDNLPPTGLVILSGHTGAYLNPEQVLFTITPGEDKVVDIQVQRGGTLRFSTTDANGNALLGSCFYLRINDANGATVNHLCDGHDGDNGSEDGITTFFKLTTGTYFWEQTIAAPNYISGQTGTIVVTTGLEETVPVANTLGGSVVVTLRNEQGDPLPGSYFRLMGDPGDGSRVEVAFTCDNCDISTNDGVATFNGIPAGDYFVVQQWAIDGYLLAPEVAATVTTGQQTSIEMVAAVAPPPSDPPVANQDDVTTNAGEPVTIYPLANDIDADTPHEELTLTLRPADGPSYGTVELDPDDPTAVVYTPNPGFTGSDGFYYEVSDGANSAIGWVRVSIVGVLELHVTSADPDGTPVRFACFDLYVATSEGVPDRFIATECDFSDPADGVTIFTGLAEGRYLLENFNPPDGFDRPDNQLVDVGPNPITTVSITFPLAPGYGSVRIHAVDGATSLPGLCWEVAPESNPSSVNVACDFHDGASDGRTTIHYLMPGTATIRALSAPGGYFLAAPQSVVLVEGAITPVSIPHFTGSALKVITTREDGSAILDACASVYTGVERGWDEFVGSRCDRDDGALDGHTLMLAVPEGSYRIVISGGESENDYLPVREYGFTVSSDGSINAGPGGDTLTVVYGQAGSATITFVDVNGDQLTRSFCYRIYHDAGAGVRGLPLTTMHTCAGFFWPPDGGTPVVEPLVLVGLAPGNYLFTLEAPTYGLALASDVPFTITAGGNTPHTITLQEQAPDATATLAITTVNVRYEPIATAWLGQTVQIAYVFSNSSTVNLTSSRLIGHGGVEVAYWDSFGSREVAYQQYIITEADAARGSITFTGTVTSDQGDPISASWTIQIVAEPNTPEDPSEPVVAAGGTGATLTFAEIDLAGFTAVTPLPEPPVEELPGGFSVDGALFYEISTTATFTGDVLVCIPYEPGTIPNARLLHYSGGAWVDITSEADSSDDRVCGITSHFSPFAIVERLDSDAPVITAPDQITEATSAAGAAVTWTGFSVLDAIDSNPVVICAVDDQAVQSGDTFALGSHDVSCTATDANDNSASASFTITVQDTTGPAFTGAVGITVEATSPAGASVPFTLPTATDLVSGTAMVTCSHASGDTFPIGITTVTCTAEDDAGNISTATFTVSVNTTLAPKHKDECKNGGWQEFNDPFFINQGGCVSFLEKPKRR